MDRNILATYKKADGSFCFEWLLEDEIEEFKEEIEIKNYTKVEIVKVNVVEEIYSSDDVE